MTQLRVLAHRCHRATREYRCDVCDHLIFPGDFYEITISVQKFEMASRISTRREHQSPMCPYPEGDFDIDQMDSIFTEEFRLAA